ncbi:hypothetical protein L1987_76970 [Smallanthus sonchifolius]|uniref:Uncharacterized protein n=1 Tax=Smallanthus sonchifolius TaxID=185202 RepID=A0ACB8Z7Q1_9ASTR|nr:hypothetical protein L1987_76970 [Smallanthus sonchifolius]
MTRFFRSKSHAGAPPPNAAFFQPSFPNQKHQYDDVHSFYQDYSYYHNNPVTTSFISPDRHHHHHQPQSSNFTILPLLLAVLRKSVVTCTVDDSDDASSATSSLDIGRPTDVQHVSHVTFDRFDGFLGLPAELQPEVPRKPPSASIRVFGVSVESMQCSYDDRWNSVPTILLMMQKRLYAGGGLQAEGIFRINAENSQEQDVRKQLNKGSVPHGIDVHCLAGLIKAWFRELPTGVLDSLTPEQVMRCNTEDECTSLAKSLPQTEAGLLDWTVNLMADVVKYEPQNKMNSHNIAMVFAPNMTQMDNPLTALIHAVQVMNFLKKLVIKTLRGREESANRVISSCEDETKLVNPGSCYSPRKSGPIVGCEPRVNHRSKQEEEEVVAVVEGILERLNLRKGVSRLCRHTVFQLSKNGKKN